MDIIDARKISARAITATCGDAAIVQATAITLGASRLEFGGDKLTFHGDADEAARMFIDKVILLYDEDMRRLRQQAAGGDVAEEGTKMNTTSAMYDRDFTWLIIGVDGRGGVLYPDKDDADCLKLAFEKLKSEPDDLRAEFYRMLLDGRSIGTVTAGILAQLPQAVVSSEILTIDLAEGQKDRLKSLMAGAPNIIA